MKAMEHCCSTLGRDKGASICLTVLEDLTAARYVLYCIVGYSTVWWYTVQYSSTNYVKLLYCFNDVIYVNTSIYDIMFISLYIDV